MFQKTAVYLQQPARPQVKSWFHDTSGMYSTMNKTANQSFFRMHFFADVIIRSGMTCWCSQGTVRETCLQSYKLPPRSGVAVSTFCQHSLTSSDFMRFLVCAHCLVSSCFPCTSFFTNNAALWTQILQAEMMHTFVQVAVPCFGNQSCLEAWGFPTM